MFVCFENFVAYLSTVLKISYFQIDKKWQKLPLGAPDFFDTSFLKVQLTTAANNQARRIVFDEVSSTVTAKPINRQSTLHGTCSAGTGSDYPGISYPYHGLKLPENRRSDFNNTKDANSLFVSEIFCSVACVNLK